MPGAYGTWGCSPVGRAAHAARSCRRSGVARTNLAAGELFGTPFHQAEQCPGRSGAVVRRRVMDRTPTPHLPLTRSAVGGRRSAVGSRPSWSLAVLETRLFPFWKLMATLSVME